MAPQGRVHSQLLGYLPFICLHYQAFVFRRHLPLDQGKGQKSIVRFWKAPDQASPQWLACWKKSNMPLWLKELSDVQGVHNPGQNYVVDEVHTWSA